jgi:hypothetical protein
MESVSHGLRKKKWEGVPSFIKKHQRANLYLKNSFVWKIVRTPLPVIDKDNHLLIPIFISLFYI